MTSAAVPLLLARLSLETSASPEDLGQCADLLARSGAALASQPLPGWIARLEILRAAVTPGNHSGSKDAATQSSRAELALRLPEEMRAEYAHSPYWRTWISGYPVSPPAAGKSRLRRKDSRMKGPKYQINQTRISNQHDL